MVGVEVDSVGVASVVECIVVDAAVVVVVGGAVALVVGC